MTNPTPLSPAARAAWEAFNQFDHAGMHVDYGVKLAAALRAAADHDPDGSTTDEYDASWRAAMDFIDAIAAELEGAQ